MPYETDQAKNDRITKENNDAITENTFAPPAPVEQPLSRAEQLMRDFNSIREPAPVHDQAKEDRLVKMGRINQIGRGIGVLGDVLAMGLGGNVRRSQPDRVSPMLYQQYQAMMDKEKADQDSYKFRSYQNERANLGMQIGEERRKDSMRLSAENLAELRLQRKQDKDENNRRYDNSELNRKEAVAVSAQNHKDNMKLGYLRLNKPTSADEKLTRPVTIRNNAGTVTLKPEDADFLKGKALQNPELIKRYPTWFTKVPELDADLEPTGNYVTKLDARIKDTDLIREQMNIEAEEKKTTTQPASAVPDYIGPYRTGATPKAAATKKNPFDF